MKVTFETTGAMRIVETKGGEPGITAGALVLGEDMTLDELAEFEERVKETFDELMDRRRAQLEEQREAERMMHDADAQLLNSYPRPHGSRNCIKAGLGFMADTAFDRNQWRNSALDRMLDTKGSETDDQRD